MISFNTRKWAEDVFGTAELGNKQRTKRLIDVAERLARNSGRSMAHACEGDETAQEGSYRLIRNHYIAAEKIREAGFRETVKKSDGLDELLALEDTTSLSFKHSVAPTLGNLGPTGSKARGWWVHSVLLLDGNSYQTVGLLDQQWWCRADKTAQETREYPEKKESAKWRTAAGNSRALLGAQIKNTIAVCDREADIFDYIAHKLDHNERFVVRAKHLRTVEQSQLNLLNHLEQQPVLGGYTVKVEQKGLKDKKGRCKNRPSRTATLEIRSCAVTFKPTATSTTEQTITVNVVWGKEINAQNTEEPLSWLLLTQEPVETLEQALKNIQIYECRWRIEDFHKAWKTGAGVERQRMTNDDNLERMASILAFVGVRLLQLKESLLLPGLKSQGKTPTPDVTQRCTSVLSREEWTLLYFLVEKKKEAPQQAPSLSWAYKAIAKLGGFTDTKRTGIASWQTIWNGWFKLQETLKGFLAAKEMGCK